MNPLLYFVVARNVATAGNSRVYKRRCFDKMYQVKLFKKRDYTTREKIEAFLNDGLTLERTVDHDCYVLYIFKESNDKSKSVPPRKRQKKAPSDPEDN